MGGWWGFRGRRLQSSQGVQGKEAEVETHRMKEESLKAEDGRREQAEVKQDVATRTEQEERQCRRGVRDTDKGGRKGWEGPCEKCKVGAGGKRLTRAPRALRKGLGEKGS